MGSFKTLNTREKANEGVKIPLVALDGSETGEHLIIRSVDSDAFREAEAEGRRDALRAAQVESIEERKNMARESTTRMHVALIKAWSFDEDFNEENVRDFLQGSPQIADLIDQLSSNRRLFIEKKSPALKRSRATSQKAPKPRKARTPRKENTSNK